jgi:hypothetical protein
VPNDGRVYSTVMRFIIEGNLQVQVQLKFSFISLNIQILRYIRAALNKIQEELHKVVVEDIKGQQEDQEKVKDEVIGEVTQKFD